MAGKIKSKPRKPRAAATYRAARRNASKGQVWQGIKPTGRIYHAPVRANKRDRSRDAR